jgi:hypothetical protein
MFIVSSTVTETGPHYKPLPDHSILEGQLYRDAPYACDDDDALVEVVFRIPLLSCPWYPLGPPQI